MRALPVVPERATAARRAAVAAHLASPAAAIAALVVAGRPVIWVGTAAFLGPMAIAALVGGRDPFARAHARAALAFNLSLAIYLGAIAGAAHLVGGSPYTVQLVPFLLFCNLLLALNWLMFCAIAAHRAGTGQLFTYPMTLRWVAARIG
jgi:uncharacterized Tic20 family protein